MPGAVVLFHDITELKQVDQIRREFVANVSHELRTPLSILRGYIEVLFDEPQTSREELTRILSIMERHSKRLQRLVDDLLSLAQLEASQAQLELSVVRMDELFNNLIRDWKEKLAAKNLKVIVDLTPEALTLHADGTRLEEVLYNLLDNAVKFSRENGEIYLRAKPLGSDMVLSVSDNGLGIGNPKTGASVCVPCSNNTHQECSGGTCHCVAGGCGGKTASLTPRTSALFVSVAAAENPEFRKAYAYARRWTPGTPLVKRGSAEFESGLYAGISDNPAQQSAWTKAHRKWANKGEQYFATRVQLHSTFTRKVASKFSKEIDGGYLKSEAATTTDLDTLDPASSPAADGSTPLNGIGQPGPLEGGQDAAAPGGPAPYNGAEPMGSPVVPNGRQAASGDPKDFLVNDIPGGPLDGNARAYAFRRRVQANLLATTKS
jgi:two-component sensor histidine kinase